jgi:hypothetical protein
MVTYMGITVIPPLMLSRPRETVHDLALSERKRGEYVSQLLRASLAAQTRFFPQSERWSRRQRSSALHEDLKFL